MENRACIVYDIQYETHHELVGLRSISYQVEVRHFYQMVWRENLLTFLWLGKNEFDERYVRDQKLGWRYAGGVGYNDITLDARQMQKFEVYMPGPQKVAQSILIEAIENENGKSSIKEYEFYIRNECTGCVFDEIREFAKLAQIELVEVTRPEAIGKTGKVLLLGVIGLWIFAILAWLLAISETPVRSIFLLLTLAPPVLIYLMMLLFQRHLVSCPMLEHRKLRNFAQISLFLLSLLPLLLPGSSEALGGWALCYQAFMLFAVLAGVFLFGIRCWRLRSEIWWGTLIVILILSFAIVRHVGGFLI